MKNLKIKTMKQRIKKIKDKELKYFKEEITERNESYNDEVKNSGFDNTHEYEFNILGVVASILVALITFIIGLILFLIIT